MKPTAPRSAALPTLAWAAFFLLAACGMRLRTDRDVLFLAAALAAGLTAIGWTVWRAVWRAGRGGVGTTAHRSVMLVSVLVLLITMPFAGRLREDAQTLWDRRQFGPVPPLYSAAELEAHAPRANAQLELSGRARCEVVLAPPRPPEIDCTRLRWGGDDMLPMRPQADPVADALRSSAKRALGAPGPDLRIKGRWGWSTHPSKQLVNPPATIDAIVAACGEAEPTRSDPSACAKLKRTLASGLWGHTPDKRTIERASWSVWLNLRAQLDPIYMRDSAPWQAALDAVVHERDLQRLARLAEEIREAQRGGVVLVLAQEARVRAAQVWPRWHVNLNYPSNAIDNFTALTAHGALERFEFRGRLIERTVGHDGVPHYWLDASRAPTDLDETLRWMLLVAWAALLLLAHGLCLLWIELGQLLAAVKRRFGD